MTGRTLTPTEDQIEAARTKVRNMLHAADHGSRVGEAAVLRMVASGELVEALGNLEAAARGPIHLIDGQDALNWPPDQARAALSLAQPYEAEVEKDDGLQTNVAPQCGVGPSDLTDQGEIS